MKFAKKQCFIGGQIQNDFVPIEQLLTDIYVLQKYYQRKKFEAHVYNIRFFVLIISHLLAWIIDNCRIILL